MICKILILKTQIFKKLITQTQTLSFQYFWVHMSEEVSKFQKFLDTKTFWSQKCSTFVDFYECIQLNSESGSRWVLGFGFGPGLKPRTQPRRNHLIGINNTFCVRKILFISAPFFSALTPFFWYR